MNKTETAKARGVQIPKPQSIQKKKKRKKEKKKKKAAPKVKTFFFPIVGSVGAERSL